MKTETERKFLVTGKAWRRQAHGNRIHQGYLSLEKERTVRVRVVVGEPQGSLAVKGISKGATRAEYEYAIPSADAEDLLRHLCVRPLIDKTRYRIEYRGLTWEIDEFAGENEGLVVAEVELDSGSGKSICRTGLVRK